MKFIKTSCLLVISLFLPRWPLKLLSWPSHCFKPPFQDLLAMGLLTPCGYSRWKNCVKYAGNLRHRQMGLLRHKQPKNQVASGWRSQCNSGFTYEPQDRIVKPPMWLLLLYTTASQIKDFCDYEAGLLILWGDCQTATPQAGLNCATYPDLYGGCRPYYQLLNKRQTKGATVNLVYYLRQHLKVGPYSHATPRLTATDPVSGLPWIKPIVLGNLKAWLSGCDLDHVVKTTVFQWYFRTSRQPGLMANT